MFKDIAVTVHNKHDIFTSLTRPTTKRQSLFKCAATLLYNEAFDSNLRIA